MKAARIVLDHVEPFLRSWCWRDEWLTGYDSSYGLFAKFALLNVLTAREVAQVFANPTCGKKTAIVAFPNVDLRDSALFDLVAMSRIMRMDLEQVRQSFLVGLLPNSRRKSIDHLKWCAKCAAVGFHTPIFQLDFVADCPIHGMPLQTRCRNCNAQVPYRFRNEVINSPFACPSCGIPFSRSLRDADTRSFETKPRDYAALANVVKLLVFEDEILSLKMELNRQRKSLGFGEVVMAPADWRRKESEYTGFVIQVLHDLIAEEDAVQYALPLEPMALVTRGTRAEPPTGSGLRKRKPDKLRRAMTPSGLEKQSWDDALWSLYGVYSAVRRHLWRHVVHKHQACITSAAKHLWWHMEGEVTSTMCPVAEAFLRWRIFWEGNGVPQWLFKPLSKPPYGVMGWLAECAPICPAGWSKPSERWVIEHIFANACLSSFRDWLQLAWKRPATQRITWSRHAMTGRFERYWAVTGHDSRERPLRIYLGWSDNEDPIDRLFSYDKGSRHQATHSAQLAAIRR